MAFVLWRVEVGLVRLWVATKGQLTALVIEGGEWVRPSRRSLQGLPVSTVSTWFTSCSRSSLIPALTPVGPSILAHRSGRRGFLVKEKPVQIPALSFAFWVTLGKSLDPPERQFPHP